MSRRHLTGRAVGWGLVAAAALVGGVVLVTWKASSPLLFLLYPLLILGLLAGLATAVLWAMRYF